MQFFIPLLALVLISVSYVLYQPEQHLMSPSTDAVPVVEVPEQTTPRSTYTDPKHPGQYVTVPSVKYVNARAEDIRVDMPLPQAALEKQFIVKGTARGPWFFEGSFPITVKDKDGHVLVQTHGTAGGEWMTETMVPFTAEVTLTAVYTGPATLILHKDNPSGEPARDASVEIPVVFR